jgi:hypothetical protein
LADKAKKEREPRHAGLLPVHVRGCDVHGEEIKQLTCTLNISRCGVRLIGLARCLKVGSAVQLQYHQEVERFVVIWTHQESDGRQWEAGLRCQGANATLWNTELNIGLDPEDFRRLLREALASSACLNRISLTEST